MNLARLTGPPPLEDNSTFRSLIEECKRWRLMLGMTQEQVSELVGITRNAYRDWESGKISNPRPQHVSALRRAVNELAARGATMSAGKEEVEPTSTNIVKLDTLCPHCKARVPGPSQGLWYCGGCSKPLFDLCSNCETPLPFNTTTCPKCRKSARG